MKTIDDVINKLSEHRISVYNYEENDEISGYELNTYTELGVNKIIFIDFRDTGLNVENAEDFIKLFNERINEINPEDEVCLYINDKRYMQEIGIESGIKDFKLWKQNLQSIFYEDEKTTQQRNYKQVKAKLNALLEEMEETLKVMPTKGNKKDECQKINLLHHINLLYSCVNGIEIEDFVPNQE